MEGFYNLLRAFMFTKLIGDIDLYTILSSLIKYVFVYIVLRFIYMIVKIIFLDMKTHFSEGRLNKSFIELVDYPDGKYSKSNSMILIDGFISIGRDISNNLVLEETYVSKRHAAIIKKDDGFYIEDLNSSNGTLVNGDRIVKAFKLQDRDKIQIGLYTYEFVLGDDI